jgi:LTXXQ motif family protein
MRAFECKGLLCATAIIVLCVSSAAEARSWRHYGYHWYGRSWNGFHPNGDERQVEKQLPSTEPRNEPRNQGDFSAAIEEMIHACDVQVQELRNMPLDGVAEMIMPTEQQRDALAQIRSAALKESESLAAACPKNLPASVHERLDTLSRTLAAMAASLAALRPTFATFYDLLNDEQKARLVTKTVSADAQPRSDQKSRSHQSRDVANRHSDSYCQQWMSYLKSWPIRQIDDRASLSDDQRATLYELTAAIYRAAGKLKTACDADDRFTPPGRIEARERQLKALQESVDAISPAFSRFENEISDTQKAQLRGVLNLSNTNGQRSVRQ